MKHILKYSVVLMAISALLIGCASPAPDSQKESTIAETSNQTSAAAAKTSDEQFPLNPSLLSFFPEQADPNDYSRGITQSSTLWKARQEVPVFARDESGASQVTDQIVKTLSQGEEFRVCSLTADPFGDMQSSKIYGQMADGSGMALLYDHSAATPSMADLKADSVWPMKIMIRLKPGTVLYEDQTGTIPVQSDPSQLLIHLTTDKDGTIWGQTQQGWFQWIDENGPGFYSAPEGIVLGPLSASNSVEDAYRQILLGKTFENVKGSLNCSYALADLNQDQIPELLITSGGINRDQTVSVYGLTSKVTDSQKDDLIPVENALLYTTSNPASGSNEVLIFQTVEDGHKILRMTPTNGKIRATELTDGEITSLKAETLQEIRFSSINEMPPFDACLSALVSDLYPDYVFPDQRNQASTMELPTMDQTSTVSTWKLNYAMTVREAPDRSSAKRHVLPKSSLIDTVQVSKNGNETWGELEYNGGWVCLQDAEYVYAVPNIPNAETNSSEIWYEVYGQILQNESTDPQYGSSLGYDPSWYLWEHPDYESPILVMKTGNCEAAYQLKFYTFINGTAQEIASCSAGHAGFYSGPEPGTFYRHTGHMGVEGLNLLTLSQGNLTSKEIYSRTDVMEYETPDGEYWAFQPVSAW